MAAAQLDADLDAALAAYEALDQDGFEASLERAAVGIPCLTEPVTPGQAARFHRLRGLAAFGRRDLELSEQRFAAARLGDPGYAFPDTLVPPASPVRERYTAIDPKSLKQRELPVPTEGALVLDGRIGTRRNLGLPVIFQRTSPTGGVVQGALLGPSDTVPDYPARVVEPEPKQKGRRLGKSVPLLIAAGVTGLASAGAYVGAKMSEGAFDELPANEPERGKALQRRTNGLSVASVGLGGIALGLGATAVIVGDF